MSIEQILETAKSVDYDKDGISNADDNCSAVYNPDQADSDNNGVGNACEGLTGPDEMPPTIKVVNPGTQIIGSEITLSFSATDHASGLASLAAFLNGVPVSTGQTVSLATPGTNNLTVTATDVAGNRAYTTNNFSVVYNFTGFLDPIINNGSGTYKLGTTLPIKFRISNSAGAPVASAVATLSVFRLTDKVLGGQEPIIVKSPRIADTDYLFRYTASGYVYNFSTKNYSQGTYRLQVTLDDATVHAVDISLKTE